MSTIESLELAPTPKLIVWADGGGSTFNSVMDYIRAGLLDIEAVGVIANNENAGSLQIARDYDIGTLVVAAEDGKRLPETENDKVLSFVADRFGDNEKPTIALLGAMTIINEELVRFFNGEVPEAPVIARRGEPEKVSVGLTLGDEIKAEHLVPHEDTGRFGLVNNHPGLPILTANLHGHHPTAQMLLGGARETAVAVHAVGTGIDTGPLIHAQRVPINDEILRLVRADNPGFVDKLARRVFTTAVQGAEKSMTGPVLARHLQIRNGIIEAA